MKYTLHVEIKDIARGTFTPDQSLSILLIAKAQYKVRKSDSLLPGTVEKLGNIKKAIMREGGKQKNDSVIYLPSSRWQVSRNLIIPDLSSFEKSSRKIARARKAVYVMMMWGVS